MAICTTLACDAQWDHFCLNLEDPWALSSGDPVGVRFGHAYVWGHIGFAGSDRWFVLVTGAPGKPACAFPLRRSVLYDSKIYW